MNRVVSHVQGKLRRWRTSRRIIKSFAFLLEPLARIRRRPNLFFSAPETAIEELRATTQNAVRKIVERDGVEGLVRRILDALPVDFDATSVIEYRIASERERLLETDRGAAFVALVDAAQSNGPLAPSYFLSGDPGGSEPVNALSALGILRSSTRLRGEMRARRLWDAVPDLVERVYGRYLRGLWGLTYLAEGEWPPSPPQLGRLVEELLVRLPPNTPLVDKDAAHIRNAVQHRHVKYEPSSDELTLWEERGANDTRPSWSLTLRVSAFEDRLRAMEAAVHTMSTMHFIWWLEAMRRTDTPRALLSLKRLLDGDASVLSAEIDINRAFASELFRGVPPDDYAFWFIPERFLMPTGASSLEQNASPP